MYGGKSAQERNGRLTEHPADRLAFPRAPSTSMPSIYSHLFGYQLKACWWAADARLVSRLASPDQLLVQMAFRARYQFCPRIILMWASV